MEPDTLTDIDLLLVHSEFVKYAYTRNRTSANKRKHDDTAEPHGRECSPACIFFEPFKNHPIFVCTAKGALHYCTSRACDQLVYTNEHRVCRLTGLVYPLDTLTVLPTHSDFCDFSRRESSVPTAFTTERQLKKARLALEPKPPRSIVTQKKASTPRHPKRFEATAARVGKPAVARTKPLLTDKQSAELECQAVNFIKQVFRLQPEYTPDKKEVARLAQVCLSTWRSVITTDYYEAVQKKYRFRPHCAAVLYNSINGIKVNGTVMLPKDPTLYAHLPPSKKVLKACKIKTYTSTSSYYHECVRELYSSMHRKED